MEVLSSAGTVASLLKDALKLLPPLVVVGLLLAFFGAETYTSFTRGAYGDMVLGGLVALAGLVGGGFWFYKRLDAVLLSRE